MIEIRDQIERRPLGALVPYARNSRTHSDEQIEQLVASMRQWGWTNPVLVDEDSGIIAGHGRVLAAERLGVVEVPVIVARGWSDDQKRAYVIADNKLALNAGWDDAVLAAELAALQQHGYAMDLIGFSSEELTDLLDLHDDGDGQGEAFDDVPPPPARAVTRLGDLWQLGPHRLLCGDSTDDACVQRLMDGAMVDVWITDPPYNVAYEGKTKEKKTIANDQMAALEFRAFLSRAFRAAANVLKPGAAFYIWHAGLEGYAFLGACDEVALRVRQCLIWKKHVMVLGRQDYHWQHEPCLYGWKDGAAHLWASDRKQTTVLEFDRPMRNAEHPTMKPVALIEYQLLNNTKGGDIVLDGFGGSGTTLIAAEKNGRIARLMELDPVYADVIVERWQTLTGQTATLAGTGETWDAVRAARLG